MLCFRPPHSLRSAGPRQRRPGDLQRAAVHAEESGHRSQGRVAAGSHEGCQ